MSLKPDQMLSHYRVAGKIGAGGMGEVWKARDTQLDRDVALKLLPPELAQEPDRLSRFEREAKLLAALNHTGIAGVYGLHEHQGLRFIAMELVPGEDLAQLLAHGPLPVDKAVELALQVADALEVAHERGIVHRDLKPANIKITPEAQVKVLDFGLAKAFEADPSTASTSLTMSPTITSAGTVAGVILGTAAYMAPEQARGQPVDKRADIWAFGCVLYEMLSGRMPFSGDTVSDTLASVLKLEPDWDALPATLPASLRRLLHRCLEKDPRKRLRDIGEARIGLSQPDTGGSEGDAPSSASVPSAAHLAAPRSSRLPWLVAAAALMVAVSGWLLPRYLADDVPPPVMRFEVDVSEGLDYSQPGPVMVLSPDGERLAYLAGEPRQLYVRRVDQFEGLALNGTQNASQPFFSPDGEWIGFFAGTEMKKVSIYGGSAIKLADVQTHRGGSWSEDGTIFYAPSIITGIHRIADSGGAPEQLTDPEADEDIRSHRWPQALPGGEAVLFTVQPNGSTFDESRIEILDLKTQQRSVVISGGSFGRYVPTGHVTYVNAGTIFAVPFDLATVQATGSAVPVVEGVSYDPRHGGARVHHSPQGHLVYLAGGLTSGEMNVAWVDEQGTLSSLFEELADYHHPRLSPDGTRLALDFGTVTPQEDIWIYDLQRGSMSRLTFDAAVDFAPIWSPDGQHIVFSSLRDSSVPNLFMRRADGSGEPERLSTSKSSQYPTSFSPDGRLLMFRTDGSGTSWDLMVMNMDDRTVEPFLVTPFTEAGGQFSPDGKWVAYDSNESGQFELYVRPYPAGGGKWQVSTDGDGNGLWAPDGKTLYYGMETQLMAVDYTADAGTFRAERPRVVIEGGLMTPGGFRSYDMTAEGRTITIVDETANRDTEMQARVILNWFDELNRRAR